MAISILSYYINEGDMADRYNVLDSNYPEHVTLILAMMLPFLGNPEVGNARASEVLIIT